MNAYLLSVQSISSEDAEDSIEKNADDLRLAIRIVTGDYFWIGQMMVRTGEVLSRMIQCHVETAIIFFQVLDFIVSGKSHDIFRCIRITSIKAFGNMLSAASRLVDESGLPVNSNVSGLGFDAELLRRVIMLVHAADNSVLKQAQLEFLDFQKRVSLMVKPRAGDYSSHWMVPSYLVIRNHLLNLDNIEGLGVKLVDPGLVEALNIAIGTKEIKGGRMKG